MSDPLLPPIVQPPRQLSGGQVGIIDDDSSPADAVENESSQGISSSRPLVFGILFGVTGAIGLPLLWFSPAFTRNEKWLWSIVNTLYTLGLVAIAIASLRVIFDAMQQLR